MTIEKKTLKETFILLIIINTYKIHNANCVFIISLYILFIFILLHLWRFSYKII